MGKKKEKVLVDLNHSSNNESSFEAQLAASQDGMSSSKKPKKHKRKKSSKKDRHQDKTVLSSKQVELIETLKMDDDDQEISIDDTEMEAENSLLEEVSGAKLAKTPESAPLDKNLKLCPPKSSGKSSSSSSSSSGAKKSGGAKRKEGAKGEDDTDSEEERWLDAIESGKLEEVDDELKRIKNPRLMTARQRALMEKRSSDIGADGDGGYANIPAEPLLALPTGFKEKVMTEEMIAKKAIKSQRRREQAIEKREEDKKKTVDRLLKKQDTKASRSGRTKNPKKCVPLTSLLDTTEGVFLSFPVGVGLPPTLAGGGEHRAPRKPTVCGAEGCLNLKKYSCSQTGVALCSLECYKRNMAAFKVLAAGPAVP